ncbi:MAG TPA: GNAT family N-acetyltransferase, partial [Acidimicrobiales bacterium]|nr:GNAT family N-acetyltransferase [Acidimicrobiales bacterium]
VAVATVSPAPTGRRPGAAAWRLRGMAVDPERQGQGAGTLLLDAVVTRARAAGAEVLWADGRDSALDFYRRRGWSVEGEGYLTPATGIPHHTVVLDLRSGG